MPKRSDIESILIIGAGPIVIGQACEFDYSGAQACKALKEEGYRIILVNSNPATIMTDPELADRTYIEPITPEIVEKIVQGKLGKFFSEVCLLNQPYIKDDKMTVEQLVATYIAKFGENIQIRRFARFALGDS